jgi:photosystem II stability/assembly factor-like uncharacterized protein
MYASSLLGSRLSGSKVARAARISSRILFAALVAAGFSARPAKADGDHWKSLGPQGGIIVALAVDPRFPSTIYAALNGGVYKSEDGGTSWVPSGLGGPNVFALAFDSSPTPVLYAGTNVGVFKSADGGVTWNSSSTGLNGARAFALAVDPQTPTTIYAGTNSGVFKSTNGGASWTNASNGLGAIRISALAVDPITPSNLYAGSTVTGVFRSSDGAASWRTASTGLPTVLPAAKIYCLAIDPKTPSTIYLGTYSGTYKSTDGASSWALAGTLASPFLSLAIDPTTPSTVYGGTAGGIQKSTDGVATWKGVYCCIITWALAVNPLTPSTIYAGADHASSPAGFYKSTRSGVAGSWTNSSAGITASKLFALAVDPSAPSTLYAGGLDGVFKSTDGGQTWAPPVTALALPIVSLAVIAGSSAVVAGTAAGTWQSTDGGATFTETYGLDSFGLAVDPKTSTTIYAAGGAGPNNMNLTGGGAKSIDGGATWSFYGGSNTPLPIFNSIAVGPGTSLNIIVGTDAGIYGNLLHKNGGYEWVTNGGLATHIVFAVVLDPSSASIVYAGTDVGLFKSIDGGLTWNQVTSLTATNVFALYFDPASPSTFYAGADGGIFQSADRGASWTPMNTGLTNRVINAFVRAPGPNGALYVATNGAGVFVWTDEPVTRAPVDEASSSGKPRRVPPRR